MELCASEAVEGEEGGEEGKDEEAVEGSCAADGSEVCPVS